MTYILAAGGSSDTIARIDVTWGTGRGCPLVVHYWADLQSVHGLRCCGNITRTKNVSEYTLVLALCLVRLVADLLYNKLGFCGMLRTCCTVVRFVICRGLAVGVDLLYNVSTCRDAVYLLYTVDLLWILLHSLLCNRIHN